MNWPIVVAVRIGMKLHIV